MPFGDQKAPKNITLENQLKKGLNTIKHENRNQIQNVSFEKIAQKPLYIPSSEPVP